MKITILDYGAGNVPSVERALQRLGVESQRTSSPESISRAEALLLPGVGHYAALVRALDEKQFRAPLLDAIGRGVPFLGICLGLQVLFNSSEEASELRGLSLLSGVVSALPPNVKLPHMGWNQIEKKRESSLLTGIDLGAYFYFAHSYYVEPQDSHGVAAITDYGSPFCSIIVTEQVWGTQFHPEKSGSVGLQLLNNFLKWIRG